MKHNHVKWTILLLLLLFGNTFQFQSQIAKAQNEMFFMVPGKQAGPINSGTSEADLKKWFGSTNVIRGEGDEGIPVSIVFPTQPSKKILIYWNDNVQRLHPNELQVQASNNWQSNWHYLNGVSIGTSIKTLEQLNGKPFELYAYCSDIGGVVKSWNKGKLDSIFPLDSVRIQLSPGLDMSKKENEDYATKHLCNNDILSSSQWLPSLKMRIGFISVVIK